MLQSFDGKNKSEGRGRGVGVAVLGAAPVTDQTDRYRPQRSQAMLALQRKATHREDCTNYKCAAMLCLAEQPRAAWVSGQVDGDRDVPGVEVHMAIRGLEASPVQNVLARL